MIRIYGVALCDLQGREDALLQTLPARIALPWQRRHPNIRNANAYLASLAGVWLLWKSGTSGTLGYTENGKPYLTDPACAISITHTQTHAFCAISDTPDAIGLDAEDLGRLPANRISALAARWFTAEEQAEIGDAPTEAAFLSVWTRKEALVKLSGAGLRDICKTHSLDENSISYYRIGNTVVTLVCRSNIPVPTKIEML